MPPKIDACDQNDPGKLFQVEMESGIEVLEFQSKKSLLLETEILSYNL